MPVNAPPPPRIRTEIGKRGFDDGREFRIYHEFTLSTVFKVVVPVNTVLWSLSTDLLEGESRLESVVGGEEGGVFTPITVFGRNNMTERPAPFYANRVTFAQGGTHTGGSVLDVLLNKTSDNANFAGSVGSATGDERGVAPNTYYLRLTVIGTTRGVLKASWEERFEQS
jgi:hypothetical protein